MATYVKATETKEFDYTAATASDVFTNNLGYFVFSLAVLNSTSGDLTIYLNQYTNDSVVVPANSYKEIAVTTNYYRVEVSATGSVSVTVVKSPAVESLLSPLFPNLYSPSASNNLGADIKVDPINAGGYTFTPWVASDGNMFVGANNTGTMLDVEYYFDGQVVSFANSTNFYSDLWNTMVNQIYGSYTIPTNVQPSPVVYPDAVSKAREFYEGLSTTYFEEEFLGGYASLQAYNEELYLMTYALDAVNYPKMVYPFKLLGFTLTATASNTTVEYWENSGDTSGDPTWHSVTLTNVGDTVTVGTGEPTQYMQVTAGSVNVTFSGNFVSMIEFAPIINIVYPLGFDDTSGVPSSEYASFQQTLTNMRQNLQSAKFTGRVIYLRWQPFEAQPSAVWNADKWKIEKGDTPVPEVWHSIMEFVPNWYQYSPLEAAILTPIIWENRTYYYGLAQNARPTTLDDFINDSNITIQGNATVADKTAFIRNLLLNEYAGSYSLGGMNTFYGDWELSK